MDGRIENTLTHFRQAHVDGGRYLFRQETAFLSFLCTLSAIEALAGYRYGNTDPGPGERFRNFVANYFSAPYHPHAARLWDFRNGMSTRLRPGGCRSSGEHHNCISRLTEPALLCSMRKISSTRC